MSKVIVPTIGRQVWFWASGLARIEAESDPKRQPEAATVVHVLNERSVHLQVLDNRGRARQQFHVQLVQPEDAWDEQTGPHCQWMPFQVGQAAKQAPAAATVAAPVPEPAPLRELTGHRVNPANDVLKIEVMDGPGAGGACHHYRITGFNTRTNPSDPFVARHGSPVEHSTVLFQNGPIKEAGANGVTHEALLAILIDRLQGFQRGAFANDYNAIALAHLLSAQGALIERTRARMARGIEGTHVPDAPAEQLSRELTEAASGESLGG